MHQTNDKIMIVGLGNPEQKYNETPHNVGFKAIDIITKNKTILSESTKFSAKIQNIEITNYQIICVKPLTYMNNSGKSILQIKHFFKIADENILIIYDDIDLLEGKIKIKSGGSSAGHNGIKSINSFIGNKYTKIRIGVGRSNTIPIDQYVLKPMSESKKIIIEETISTISNNIHLLIEKKYDILMSKTNTQINIIQNK